MSHPNPLSDPDTFSEDFDGLDSLSEKLEYAPVNEEAYMTTYEGSILRDAPGVL
jgi:hypothetical protein